MKNNEIKKLLINFKSNPDKALYISVIFQAVLDASKDNFCKEKKEAIAWFCASIGVTCKNFEFICDNAGLEPKTVRQFASYVINSNEKDELRNTILRIMA